MKRSLIWNACLVGTLCGCSSPGWLGRTERVQANPTDFTSSTQAPVDEGKALAVEREGLTQTIAQLRGEVSQLRQLFRLQNAPLNEATSADALGEARFRAAPAKPAIASSQGSPVMLSAEAPAPASKLKDVAPTYTALFKFASASLDDTSRAALGALRPQLVTASKVSVSAFADTTGTASSNAKLAQARAAAVEQELVKLGVPKERILISTAVSDSKPPEHTTILGLFRAPDALSRRVDLAWVKAPSTTY